MVRTAPQLQRQGQAKSAARDEVLERFRRLQAKLRADNPDMTEADWDAFADRLTAEVDEGLRDRVRKSRGKTG